MQRTPTTTLFIVAVITLGGCAGGPTLPDPPKAAIHDTLIVPRVRIGPAALGMTEANMLDWLGEPTKTVEYGARDNQYVYEDKGLLIGFSRGKAMRVAVSKRPYATSDGISIGTSELKLRTTWGQPTKRRLMTSGGYIELCFSNGMQALLEMATRQVIELSVRADGCGLP